MLCSTRACVGLQATNGVVCCVREGVHASTCVRVGVQASTYNNGNAGGTCMRGAVCMRPKHLLTLSLSSLLTTPLPVAPAGLGVRRIAPSAPSALPASTTGVQRRLNTGNGTADGGAPTLDTLGGWASRWPSGRRTPAPARSHPACHRRVIRAARAWMAHVLNGSGYEGV